jgi:hypothetical protein
VWNRLHCDVPKRRDQVALPEGSLTNDDYFRKRSDQEVMITIGQRGLFLIAQFDNPKRSIARPSRADRVRLLHFIFYCWLVTWFTRDLSPIIIDVFSAYYLYLWSGLTGRFTVYFGFLSSQECELRTKPLSTHENEQAALGRVIFPLVKKTDWYARRINDCFWSGVTKNCPVFLCHYKIWIMRDRI